MDSVTNYLRDHEQTTLVYLEFNNRILELWEDFAGRLGWQRPIVEHYVPYVYHKIRSDVSRVFIICPEQDGPKAYILQETK